MSPFHKKSKLRYLLFLFLGSLFFAGITYIINDYWLWIQISLMRPVKVEKCVIRNNARGYRYSLNEAKENTLYKIGSAPTPISIAYSHENDDYIFLFLYEVFNNLAMLTINKSTLGMEEQSVPDTKLTYGIKNDVRNDNILWISTCVNPYVFRYDTQKNHLEKIHRIETESHIFCLDQHLDATLFIGTFPNARCIRIYPDEKDKPKVAEIQVDKNLINGRKYLHGLYVSQRYLFLHYASPGILVRYDLKLNTSELLMKSERAFLDFRVVNDTLYVSDTNNRLLFNRQGDELAKRVGKISKPNYSITTDGLKTTIYHKGKKVDVSLKPRKGGMLITCLSSNTNGKIYGGTYWNTWMFELDPEKKEIAGLGYLPGGSGEFFTIGGFNGKVAIPNYQGMLYLYDWRKPFNYSTLQTNPSLFLKIPDAHFGLSCITDEDGRFIYSTHPNYHQESGMLIVVGKSGEGRVFKKIGANITLKHLLAKNGRLYGGTYNARGSGLTESGIKKNAAMVLSVSKESGRILSSIVLSQRRANIEGLAALSSGNIVAATSEKKIFIIESNDEYLGLKRIYKLRMRIRALCPYDQDNILILTKKGLLIFSQKHGEIFPLVRIQKHLNLRHLTVDTYKNVYMATPQAVFLLAQEMIEPKIARRF